MKSTWQVLVCLWGVLPCGIGYAQAQSGHEVTFDIRESSLEQALTEFGRTTGLQVLFKSEVVTSQSAPSVVGTLTAETALQRLLAGSQLQYQFINSKTVTIRDKGDSTGDKTTFMRQSVHEQPGSNGRFVLAQAGNSESTLALASAASGQHDREQLDEVNPIIPEILIRGSRVLNTDTKRSRDGVQPYVIFDRAVIEQSATTNLEEFLKTRLSMNTQSFTSTQVATGIGATSRINLRGLGTNQTLILIDGRRTANTYADGTPGQPDLNGIPLAAVERVEILPTTASGIYGGSATGGVINVIMRRDYSGLELKGTYGSTFDADVSSYQADIGTSMTFDEGRTNVMLTGSLADGEALPLGDRDFVQRGTAQILENNSGNPLALNSFGVVPPLGATTNIMSLDGSPLFGSGTSSISSVPDGYVGGGGLAPLQQNAGSYNLRLPNNAQTTGLNRSLLAGTRTQSAMAAVRRDFSPKVQAFLEGSYVNRRTEFESTSATFSSYVLPNTSPTNPFGQDVFVTVPVDSADFLDISKAETSRLAGGVIVALSQNWTAGADYTWGQFQVRPSSNSTLSGLEALAIADGSLDVLRDGSVSPIDFSPYMAARPERSPFTATSGDVVLRIAGPVWSLPGGPIRISSSIEHRNERFATNEFSFPGQGVFVIPSRSQTIDSIYLEADIPIVSNHNSRRSIQSLDVQLSGRRDEYKIRGVTGSVFFVPGFPSDPIVRVENDISSTNPTVGVRYQPIADVTLRASYGTGFLPPGVEQLASTTETFDAAFLTDPQRGNEPLGLTTFLKGGNATLRPEDSENWSAGMILTPRFAPGFRLSVDWTQTEKTDNIIPYPGSYQGIIADEGSLPGRIVRDQALPGDPFGVGPITIIDDTLINIAKAKIDTYDVSLDYHRATQRFGEFDLYWLGTWQPHYRTRLVPAAKLVEHAGVSDSFPLRFKFNGGLTWSYRVWSLGWATRFFDDYLVMEPTDPLFTLTTANQGNGGRVSSQSYHDLLVGYRMGESSALNVLTNTEIQLTVRNIFDHRPPFDAENAGTYYSYYGDPRLASYSLMLKKRF